MCFQISPILLGDIIAGGPINSTKRSALTQLLKPAVTVEKDSSCDFLPGKTGYSHFYVNNFRRLCRCIP